MFDLFRLEHGLFLGTAMFVTGGALLSWAFVTWWQVAFQDLDYAATMRFVIPGVMLASLGFQTILASGFISVLGMRRS